MTEGILEVTRNWGGAGNRKLLLKEYGVPGAMKSFRNRL